MLLLRAGFSCFQGQKKSIFLHYSVGTKKWEFFYRIIDETEELACLLYLIQIFVCRIQPTTQPARYTYSGVSD